MTPSDIKIPREVVEKLRSKLSIHVAERDQFNNCHEYHQGQSHGLEYALALLAPYLEGDE